MCLAYTASVSEQLIYGGNGMQAGTTRVNVRTR